MNETPDDVLAALLGTAVTGASADRSELVRLSGMCWPGRDDRSIPAGRQWLLSRAPRALSIAEHACGARCGVCN